MRMAPLLEAALNGSRSVEEHPWIPRTPGQLAITSRAVVDAGAQVLHLHPYDPDGRETFEASVCAAAIRAVRYDCPGVPISLTTSADIEPDPARRFRAISQWHHLPELVTANQGEEGIIELCNHLLGRGVGIEAGLLTAADAEAFVRSGIAARCVRVLVEPLDPDVDAALAEAAAIEAILAKAGMSLEQVHHGDGVASWAVSARGLARGHGMRTGLEDTIYLPDGVQAADNAELVRTAATLLT
jgi:uncharacterized protein (DUF849 family)